MKKRFSFLIIVIMFFSKDTFGQGLNIHLGSSSFVNEYKSLTPENTAQTGWHIGADARLNEGKMFFNLGLQYHNIAFTPSTSFDLFPDQEKFNVLKFRVGLGYYLFEITDLIQIRGKTLGSLGIINGIPQNQGFNFNETIGGVTLGLGIDFLIFTFDVDLEIGLINALNQITDSKYDSVSFSLGVII